MNLVYLIIVSIIVIRNPHLLGLGAQGIFVRGESSKFEVEYMEKLIVDVLFVVLIVVVFVLGWQLSMKVIRYYRKRRANQQVELATLSGPPKDDDLPRDMALAIVDGRELRITLEWCELKQTPKESAE